ncbi:hypothetical protein PMG11_10091 [Penicillium brasilianum]|uniref:Uncharacterized protein n=1 Tax=Penicillium brasilianum TaxID=104259 RepID=A0A0F7U007_PENBI|nr:hypothetical protein PMG11_10091 [Penicillium brasilianum]
MSPIVIGTGISIEVYVSSGYNVSNSINVSNGLDGTTAINGKENFANEPSGVMIAKPIKTRRFGRALTGCLGSQTQEEIFQAKSYEEGSYAGVRWNSGAITMYTKMKFPLSRWEKQGTFV